MQLSCPCCAAEFPMEAGFADAEGKRLAAALAELEPSTARALIAYLRLHKPRKTVLRQSRALKLAGEIAALIATGEVSSEGRTLRATPSHWAAAMDQMATARETLRLPLDGHGYLTKVVFGLAETAAADAERRREDDRRSGRHRGAAPGPIDAVGNAKLHANRMIEFGQWSQAQADAHVAEAKAKAGNP